MIHEVFRREAISIEKYMELELPLSRVADNGHQLIDSFLVQVVDCPNLWLYVAVARTADGYHWTVNYETPTGAAHVAVHNFHPPVGKLEALEAAIKSVVDYWCVTQYKGNKEAMKQALAYLDRYKYQQLTLF